MFLYNCIPFDKRCFTSKQVWYWVVLQPYLIVALTGRNVAFIGKYGDICIKVLKQLLWSTGRHVAFFSKYDDQYIKAIALVNSLRPSDAYMRH